MAGNSKAEEGGWLCRIFYQIQQYYYCLKIHQKHMEFTKINVFTKF